MPTSKLVYCAPGKKSLLNDVNEKKRKWNSKKKDVISPSMQNLPGKRLRNCRKTDYIMNELPLDGGQSPCTDGYKYMCSSLLTLAHGVGNC
jgi:hypothetical protein